jgi:phage/plasmid-like protein (TIGR03299 family)
MAHEFESGFFVENPPWHKLGKLLTEAPTTAGDAIIQAGLDWEVTKTPIMALDGTFIQDHFAIIRDNQGTCDSLGVVGNQYEPVQNKDAFSFFDSVIQDGDATYDTAGSLKGGRIIWILAKLNGALKITKDDYVEKHLLLYNSHDGSSAVTMQFTPIRVVCNNTLSMAKATANERYKLSVRHTPTVLSRMQGTATYLGYVDQQFERTGEAYRVLAGVGINTQALEKYLKTLFPDPQGDFTRNRNAATREKCIELFETGIGTEGTPPTMWRAYNSVTEYVDHVRNQSNDEARVRSAWIGQGAQLKQKALYLALEAA